jgi:delta8-fatty-acid desaturase
MGFSCDWWTEKHNTHHALTNLRGADPDIDTLPLLAFSERDLPAAGPLVRGLVRLQPFTLLPLLAFARLNWLLQSLIWVLRAPGVKRRWTEMVLLLGHHAWSLALLALLPDWPRRLGFYALSQLLSGLMVGSVFVVGHSARPIADEGEEGLPGFHSLQIAGTQNITSPRAFRWFFGGLEQQIEHHLFPTMPRHNYRLVAPEVRAICARHGLEYREEGLFAGLASVLVVLRRVARAAREPAARPEGSPAE